MEAQPKRRTVGVVGGMGPLATAAFLRTLVLSEEAASDADHVHVLVDSDPTIPDRTAFLLGNGEDPRPAIVRAARRLLAAGAELLVMPCNTANAFVDEVEAAVGVPFVRWLETGVDAALRRTIADPARVGLLATTGTLRAGVYARVLAARGAVMLVPNEYGQAAVMNAIYGPGGVKATGRVSAAERQGLLEAAGHLGSRGAHVLLLGCTELPLAVDGDDAAWPLPAVDPACEVARLVITRAGGRAAAVPRWA